MQIIYPLPEVVTFWASRILFSARLAKPTAAARIPWQPVRVCVDRTARIA